MTDYDTLFDGLEVCKRFAEYFKEQGQPRFSTSFYEGHKVLEVVDMVVLKGSPASDAGEDELMIASSQEVSDALDRLNLRRPWTKDSIAGEHVIYATEVLVEALDKFFNAIFMRCHIPSSFLECTIKPIWKKKGLKDDPTKYRGIMITSTLGKVFKDVLTKKMRL